MLLAAAPPAAALEPGTVIVGAQATSGAADFVAAGGGFLAAYDHGEIGAQVQLWYLTGEHWALAVAGGLARSREKNRSDAGAERVYQQRAWSARIGLDRIVPLGGGDVLLYMGPGVEYWTGHARFIGYFADPDVIAPDVTRFSLSARIGALLVVTDTIGLTAHLGSRMGYATAAQGGAESGWYTQGFEAGAGVALAF